MMDEIPPSNVGKFFEGDLCREQDCPRSGPHYPGEYGCKWNWLAKKIHDEKPPNDFLM